MAYNGIARQCHPTSRREGVGWIGRLAVDPSVHAAHTCGDRSFLLSLTIFAFTPRFDHPLCPPHHPHALIRSPSTPVHMSYACCFRFIALPILSLYTLVTLSVVLITMAVIHLSIDIHPSKRRRTFTGAVISTAVSAAVIGTGVWAAISTLVQVAYFGSFSR